MEYTLVNNTKKKEAFVHISEVIFKTHRAPPIRTPGNP